MRRFDARLIAPARQPPALDERGVLTMVTLLLLRHGETALNRAGALRGRLDVELTEHGVAEANALSDRLNNDYALSTIHASPLLRARQTADAIAAPSRMVVEMCPGVIDVDYGPWAGRSLTDAHGSDAEVVARWRRDPSGPLPGMEDPGAARDRAIQALADVVGRAGDGCLAVVSHDAILQLVLGHLLGLPLGSYTGIAQSTTAVNEVAVVAGSWRVQVLNSDWHVASAAHD